MVRFQRGSLRKEARKAGPTWVLRHYVTRQSDSKRVEHKMPIGLVRDFKTESASWAEVERQHLELSMWGGSTGSSEKSMVAFKSERIAPGLYKIEVASDLKAGEYCFVAGSAMAGSAQFRLR